MTPWQYSTFICPFESGKEGKKIQKLEYLENEQLFRLKKAIFIVFEGLLSGEKIKNSRHIL